MNWLSAMLLTGDAVVADERLEVALHLARGLVALARVLRERLHHDALEVRPGSRGAPATAAGTRARRSA